LKKFDTSKYSNRSHFEFRSFVDHGQPNYCVYSIKFNKNYHEKLNNHLHSLPPQILLLILSSPPKTNTMKKLIIAASLSLILGLFSCKKETVTPTSQEEIATAKPISPPPPPSILQWQKTYGSASNELGYTITKTNDGNGYVFVGSALANGGDITGHHGGIGADAWVVKTNSLGTIEWQKCFGGTVGDYAYDIIATVDGGFVFAGTTQSNNGDVISNQGGRDVWVVKLDGSGVIAWQKTFGGSADEAANSLIQTSDGGLLVAGYTNSNNGDISGSNHGGSDAWILKLNASGDIVWQKTYGGTLGDGANSIIQTSDDNYMVAAGTSSTDGDLSDQFSRGGNDCWVFKVSGTGDLLWQKTYGGSQGEDASGIFQTPGGDYVFSSTTSSNNGNVSGNHGYADTWVVKINTNGDIIWQKCFGGFDMDNARIRDIDAAGKIVLAGYTFSKNGDIPASKGGEDLWILRLDPDGNKLYSGVFGGKGGDMANDAIPTTDGGYITSGRSNSTSGDVSGNHGGEDVWVMKFKF